MIAVIGSINVDFVVTTSMIPNLGETVQGEDFTTTFGGKGANQAIAAARLGAEVSFFGAVGGDSFGQLYLDHFKQNNVNTDAVIVRKDLPTGSAHIRIYKGDNEIIIVPGANQSVDVHYIKSVEEKLLRHNYFVIQNEIPLETIEYLIQLADEHHIKVIYDPAPFREISVELLNKCTFLTPNETEASLLFSTDVEDAMKRYPNQLLITLGEKGIQYFDGEQLVNIPSLHMPVVDTTGAGDTFNGAFAFAMSNSFTIRQAIEFARLASGLTVTQFGAQGGMPTLEDMRHHDAFDADWPLPLEKEDEK